MCNKQGPKIRQQTLFNVHSDKNVHGDKTRTATTTILIGYQIFFFHNYGNQNFPDKLKKSPSVETFKTKDAGLRKLLIWICFD